LLILTRQRDQAIRIGPDITVTVMAIGRGKVRLGIEAPDEVRIGRTEREEEST